MFLPNSAGLRARHSPNYPIELVAGQEMLDFIHLDHLFSTLTRHHIDASALLSVAAQ